MADRGGAGGAGLPRGPGARSGPAQQRPVRSEGPCDPPGAGRARGARLRRAAPVRRRSCRADHHPQGGPGRGGGGGAGRHRCHARRGRPAGRAGVRAARYRRGAGLLRRRDGHRLRLRAQRRHGPAAGLDVQAVRPRDRAVAGHEPAHPARRQRREGVPGHPSAHRELRRKLLRTCRSRRGDPAVCEHRLLPARPRGRTGSGRRDGARGGHPGRHPSRQPRRHRRGRHRPRQLRGAGHGPGCGLRDVRQQGRAGGAVHGP